MVDFFSMHTAPQWEEVEGVWWNEGHTVEKKTTIHLMSHKMSSLFTHRNGTALNKALRMPCMRKCAHHRSKTYLRNQIRNCVLYKCLFVHRYYISPPTPGFLFECLQKKWSLRKRAAQKLNKYWRECAPHIFNQSIYLYLRQQTTSLVCKSTQSNIWIVICQWLTM